MSCYVRSAAFETTFDGVVVKAMLKPLKIPDALRANESALTKPDLTDREVMERKAIKRLEFFSVVLPAYVTDMTGVKAKDGTEVGIQEVCESAYFIDLIKDLGNALIMAANEANPQQPSEPSVAHSAGNGQLTATPNASAG